MSRVRIYQCTTYKKQNVLNPTDEPLELHAWENFLFVSTKCSFIEIYNMDSLELVGRFCTISRAETIVYSEFGNCIVTLERDSDIVQCFVRLYMGFPFHLGDLVTDSDIETRRKESFLMVDRDVDVTKGIDTYLTGGMTRQDPGNDRANESKEIWDVERIELPSQGAVNCVGACSHTGFMAVAWETSITLYILTQDSVTSLGEKPREDGNSTRCGVTVLMEIELGFVVTKVVLEDIYLACLSEFEVQVFKLGLMPDRYTCVPKEKILDPESVLKFGVETLIEDENNPEIMQSEDFIRLTSFYSYPALHLKDSNSGESGFNPSILETPSALGEEHDANQNTPSIENHCIIFPSVSKEKIQTSNKDEQNKRMMEIWGPRRLTGNRTFKVTTPDGHKLTNSGISTMLYLKLPYTIGKINEYSLSTTNDQPEKNIDMFHTIKLVPEYIYEGEKKHLVGICLLVASKKEGHFYDILDFCRKIVTFPFTKDLIDIAMSPGLMHVVYSSRIEVYITRSYGVASENARNLIRQGKAYDTLDTPSSASTPVNKTPSTPAFCEYTPMEGQDPPTPFYWLYQVSPPTQDMDISQIGQSSFVNLTSCTNTNNRLAILSKLKPEVKSGHSFSKFVRKNSPKIEEIIWSVYILDIVPLHSIAKQMEMMAQPYISENPPIYFQLICDAHFLRKSALSGAVNSLCEDNEVECANVEGSIDSLVISLNLAETPVDNESCTVSTDKISTKQLVGIQKSCLLIANFLRQENEQLSLEYYKQGSHDINQFLQNSIFSINVPVPEDSLPESLRYSIAPSSLRSMANKMCFSQSDANSLAKSIIHKENLQQEESTPQQNDSIVFIVFNLCVQLENNDETKAKESACELFLRSKEFSVWANDHLNSLVSKEDGGNLSLLAMFLLIETPTLMIPLFPKMCLQGLVKAGNIIELIKHNTEDIDRDEMVVNFITDLIRVQATVEDKITELELAITELISLCFKLFEFQIELDTRQFDNVCAEYRPSWLDSLPPFSDYGRDNVGMKGMEFIFIAQNILCSPLNTEELSEKILEITTSSKHYEGIRAIISLKLRRYKDLVIIFLNKYQSVFPKLGEYIQVKSERTALIQCIVNEILINTGEDDMLSRELRETVCYFIVSLTRHMSYDEILDVLPERSPADLYKRCFDFHLHIEKSNLIVQGLCDSSM